MRLDSRRHFAAAAAALALAAVAPHAARAEAAPDEAATQAATGAASEAVSFDSIPADWALKGVVIFSRHGIRGPLIPAKCNNADPSGACMDALASRPWPTYGVIAQNLIPDGYDRVATLGRYYRALYASEGAIAAKGCPDASFVSDDTERTVMTAGALADGMFPGCSPPFAIEPDVYTPAGSKACPIDTRKSNRGTQRLLGGTFAQVANGDLRRPLDVMSRVLGSFKPSGCTYNGGSAPCTLSTLPASNRIQTADQPSEQFLMQYAAGMPVEEVAWGRLPAVTGQRLPDAITEVNAIHARYFRAIFMPEYLARRQGSQAMSVVMTALEKVHDGKQPLFVFAGHDDNILNMAGMLGLKWQLDTYQPYQVPPGGAVAFEVWDRPSGGQAVRLVYFAQTIEQMRHDTELTLASPPARAVMPVAGCRSVQGACPWADFKAIVEAAIIPACLGQD